MFGWAVREGWADANPASGLLPGSQPQLARRGFTPRELSAIFEPLSAEPVASWLFWIPVLGLYTGARLGEICQLLREDVREEGGVLFLNISTFDSQGRRAGSKRLKTLASARRVPLRPEVLAAGFDVLLRSDVDPRLFPGAPLGREGDPTHAVSRWFGRHLDRCGLTEPSLVFHSFRHGFRDLCEAAGLSGEHQRALCGWTPASVGERYGGARSVAVLARELAKLNFGGFEPPRPPSLRAHT